MSIISRLRAVVAGDDYLDGEYDELDYDTDDQMEMDHSSDHARGGALAPPSDSSPFDLGGGFSSSNVIGMPGIASASPEVNLMEPRSFDEMPRAIQALRERKTVILNLTMMEPDQAQRAVDFVAGGTFAIDGHQERVGESIFLFAPSCVTVSNVSHDDASSPTVVNQDLDSTTASSSSQVASAAPVPAWEVTSAAGL